MSTSTNCLTFRTASTGFDASTSIKLGIFACILYTRLGTGTEIATTHKQLSIIIDFILHTKNIYNTRRPTDVTPVGV